MKVCYHTIQITYQNHTIFNFKSGREYGVYTVPSLDYMLFKIKPSGRDQTWNKFCRRKINNRPYSLFTLVSAKLWSALEE